LKLGQTGNNIGPGKYHHKIVACDLKNLTPKGGVIGKDKKYHYKKNDDPGPGLYTPNNAFTKSHASSASINRALMNKGLRGEIIPCGNLGQVTLS